MCGGSYLIVRLVNRLLGSDKSRFVIAGASTTAVSYLVYLLLLLAFQAKLAYGLAYALGILWSYWINSTWVFRRKPTWTGLLSFPLVYVVQALASFGLFALLVDRLSMSKVLAPLLIVVLMLPVTFLLGRLVIDRTSPHRRETSDKSPHDLL